MTEEEFAHERYRALALGAMAIAMRTVSQIEESLPIKNNFMSYNASKKIADYNAIVEKNEGKSYHDLIMENYKKNPDHHHAMLDQAAKMGKEDSEKFLDKVHNWQDPGHEAALKDFHEKHDRDPEKVKKHFVDKAQKLLDVKPVEFRNQSFESGVLNNRTTKDDNGTVIKKPLDVIRTREDGAIIQKYKNLLASKFSAEGYEGTQEVADEFWAQPQHKLSYE